MLNSSILSLMIYFLLVSLIGTFGNGIILFTYGNRWNSSKSTSIIFIRLLACVDLWTCLIVVPTIAVMEYREFEVATALCRFYSFSKILIITSSLVMSFIAVDRFLSIAVPHHRWLNPRRVQVLLTLFILIGIGLGILTSLAFSSAPNQDRYLVNYTLLLPNETYILKHDYIALPYGKENVSAIEIFNKIESQISKSTLTNVTNIKLKFLSRHHRCFADTSIISETTREILRHLSNKLFFVSIGIVTIFYTITFVLALQRQNPRIRALKKSLHVLNQFDTYPPIDPKRRAARNSDRQDSLLPSYSLTKTKLISKNILSNDDKQHSNKSTEDLENVIIKQVSFHIKQNEQNSSENLQTYYKLQCPCSTTRQLLIKLNFAQSTIDKNNCLCRCCCCCFRFKKVTLSSMPDEHQTPRISSGEDETSTINNIISTQNSPHHSSISTSETLKKQIYQHRLKRIRMATTFLLITVSFVFFYLPSILYAEQHIKGSIIVYYLYLCTHALNPIIYCFMNVDIRSYVFSSLKCRTKQRHRNMPSTTIFIER